MLVWVFAFAAWVCEVFFLLSPANEGAEAITSIRVAKAVAINVFIQAPAGFKRLTRAQNTRLDLSMA